MSKAGGSLVTNAFSASIPGLINVGGSVAAAGAGFLIWVAWMMGKKFDELMETGEIVGGDPEVTPWTGERLPILYQNYRSLAVALFLLAQITPKKIQSLIAAP